MRAFGLWILSIIMVAALWWGLGGESWGVGIGVLYGIGSGIGYAVYRLTRKKKSKFHSTKIELGKGKGFIVPIKDPVVTK